MISLEDIQAELEATRRKLRALRVLRDLHTAPIPAPAEPKRVTPASKVCVDCKEDKPAEAFAAQPRHRDGLSSHCRACHKKRYHKAGTKLPRRAKAESSAPAKPARLAAIAERAAVRVIDPARTEKPCPGPLCNGKVRPRAEFGIAKDRADGMSWICRECFRHKYGKKSTPEKTAKPRAVAGKPGYRAAKQAELGNRDDLLICNHCDKKVTRAKAGQHMYEEHRKNVGVEEISKHFEELSDDTKTSEAA